MTVKILIKQHLEFLSLKGGHTGVSESIHVKILEITFQCSNQSILEVLKYILFYDSLSRVPLQADRKHLDESFQD